MGDLDEKARRAAEEFAARYYSFLDIEALTTAFKAFAEERDKHWTEVAQRNFEGVRPWSEMTGGFDDVAEFVLHEVWKRDPRVGEAREEERRAVVEWLRALGEEHYPVDVFGDPPQGQHGSTVDSCSARAARSLSKAWAIAVEEGAHLPARPTQGEKREATS